MFAERKQEFLKRSRGYRTMEPIPELTAELDEGQECVQESDSETESFPIKPTKYSASLASTSCGNSPRLPTLKVIQTKKDKNG